MSGGKAIVSLFDYSTEMVKPWLKNGYTAFCFDIQHENKKDGPLHLIGDNILDHEKTLEIIFSEYHVIFLASFPPCTDLAVSGARWFKEKAKKDPDFQKKAMELVLFCDKIGKLSMAPYFIENPVSVISRLWRKPDYTFHPYEFAGYSSIDEYYTKKTCLWAGNNFSLPPKKYDRSHTLDSRIHKMPPSKNRANLRSKTPSGFAESIYRYYAK